MTTYTMSISNIKNYVKDLAIVVFAYISVDMMAMISSTFGVLTAVTVFLTAFIRLRKAYKFRNDKDNDAK